MKLKLKKPEEIFSNYKLSVLLLKVQVKQKLKLNQELKLKKLKVKLLLNKQDLKHKQLK
jgi:hypothetical protein